MKNIFHLNKIAFMVLFMLMIVACTENFLDVTNPNDIVADVTQNPEGMRKVETGMFYFLKTQYNYFWQLWLAECAGEYQFVSNAEEGPENIRIYNLIAFSDRPKPGKRLCRVLLGYFKCQHNYYQYK